MPQPLCRVGLVLTLMASFAVAQSNAELKEQVRQREAAFAKTMADRDHAGFVTFLASDVVFFSANGDALRGAAEVGPSLEGFLRKQGDLVLMGA